MANKRMEFLIGIMVLTVFITVIVMTILFGPQRKLFDSGRGQRMTITFDKATGITNNSRVMKSGIEIGRVYKSELVEDPEKAEVRVFFNLNPDAKIYSNEYARINRTILGDAAIEFVKNPKWKGEIIELQPDDPISGVPGGDLTATVSNIEGDLAKAIQSVNSAAKELTLFMGNLNNFLGTPEELNVKKGRLESIFKELNETLITTRNLAGNMNSIVADKNVQENIRTSAANLPNILAKVDALLGNANILADDFRETMAKTHDTFDLVGKNLDNLNDFTTALSEEGPEFISSMNASSGDIRKMVGNISRLSEELTEQINNPSTPLGMMSDPATGDSLHAIIKNTEVITEKVHPILDDAKVFTNKIAHKPSSLLWSKESYKGASPLGEQYNFQPYSPGGGTSSTLFNASKTNSRPVLPKTLPDGSINPAAVDPDTYEAYYSLYPENSSPAKNCLASTWDRLRFSLGRKTEIADESSYYVDNPIEYYGDEQENFQSGEAFDSYADGVMPEDLPTAEKSGRFCFSLSSLCKKIFRTRGEETIVSEGEEFPISSNAVYDPQGEAPWTSDASWNENPENAQNRMNNSAAPAINSPFGANGGNQSAPNQRTPLDNPADGNNPAPLPSPTNSPDSARIEELPFESSPAASGYQGNANIQNLPGPGSRPKAIRLVPKQPEPTPASMSNSSNAQQPDPAELFLDDGLPMQFSPALME